MAESENVVNLKAVKEKRETDALIQEMRSSPPIEPSLRLENSNLVLSWSVLGYESGARLLVVMHHNPGDSIPCTTIGAFSCTADQWKQFVKEGTAILDAHTAAFAKKDPSP